MAIDSELHNTATTGTTTGSYEVGVVTIKANKNTFKRNKEINGYEKELYTVYSQLDVSADV